MEPFNNREDIDNIEDRENRGYKEDREDRNDRANRDTNTRLARIQRMRREKERQEQRRRIIKKLLPLGTGAIIVIVLAVLAVGAFGNKPENETKQPQPQTEELAQANDAENQEHNENRHDNKQTDADAEIPESNPAEAESSQTSEQNTEIPESNPAESDSMQTSEQNAEIPESNPAEAVSSQTSEQNTEISESSPTQSESTETQENNQADFVAGMPETTNTDIKFNKYKAFALATETAMAKLQELTVAYRFESTPDTVTINNEEIASTNIILIDESTDTIIASKGATERICPASMTKVLTVLVAAEHITEENLDDTFTVTSEFTDYAYVNDCSSVGFVADEIVTVRDLFYGTVLPSGGDAAVALATYVAGSHEAFVDMMNDKLNELGLSDSAHFTNCVGLYDENHYCTVYDMAVIMKAAIQNELCREFLSAHTYTTTATAEHPEGIIISNWFLRRIEDKDTGGEVLCAKTGYVVESGSCAVSYGAFADGKPYICVTTGSTSSWRCIYDHVDIYNQYIS